MNITLFRFSKKPNSTAVPEGGHETTAQIYNECSLLSPALLIGESSPERYNYAYVQAWSRYYWITDWRWDNGRWIASLSVDALASWRSQIGASSQYILRAANLHNGGLLDSLYPCVNTPTVLEDAHENPWGIGEAGGGDGSYVAGIVGPGTRYYTFTAAQFSSLCRYIFSDSYADDLLGGEVWSDVYPQLKAQTNPLQYISSVRYYPFDMGGSDVSSVPVGWVSCPVSAKRLSDRSLYTKEITFTFPRHPQIGRGSYLNAPPYSRYHLFIPPWGCIDVSSQGAAEADTIDATINVDPRTGIGVLRLRIAGAMDSILTSQVGVDIQLAQITAPGWGLGNTIQMGGELVSQLAGTVGTALGAVANPTSAPQAIANTVAGAASTVSYTAGKIGEIGQSKIPSVTSIGNPGGWAPLIGASYLVGEFMPVAANDPANKGSPACQIATISSAGGYVQISGPHLQIPCTPMELNTIYAAMTGGMYYE